MSSVDNRVVQMQFDNAAFESKVASTIQSLDKLKSSLDFANSKRGLDDLSAASRNFNMGGMGTVIEGINTKFLAMATIGITALSNITSKAIATGSQMMSAFTIDPVKAGFKEYETNMTSIQTILSNTSSKGTGLADVNKALDELNTYSDQTIYNFGEMARNIGTFTAAGVGLDTSTKSIKGIANLAAMSGSSSEQAATAMYQLSQAIASGSVKLMDWNSVVNAGMGGEIFQKALFESGKAMKTLTGVPMGMTFDQWKAKGNSFRESLQDGWITSEVLTKTLSAFTGDLSEQQIMQMGYTKQQAAEFLALGKNGKSAATEIKTFTQLMSTVKESIGSGWSQTFRIFVGDFGEAKALFTNVGNAIGNIVGKSADARNALFQGWKDLGGRNALIAGLTDAFQSLGYVINAIKSAFRSIFPPKTAAQLFSITQAFATFAEDLSNKVFNYIPRITQLFKGLFAGIQIGWEIIKGITGLFAGLFGTLAGASTGPILGFFGKIASFLINLNTSLVQEGGIKNFFEALEGYIKRPIESLKTLTRHVVEFFQAFSVGEAVSAAASSSVERIGSRFEKLSSIFSGLGRIVDVLEKVWDKISGWFAQLGQKLAATVKPGDFDAVVDVVNIGLLGGIALLLKKFLSGGLTLDVGGGIFDKIKGALDGLTGTLQAMQANLKSKTLMKIAGAIAILTVSVVALSLIDSASLTKALTAISVGFAQLVLAMAALDKMTSGKGSAKLAVVATGMMILAGAMAILSIAVKNLSGLSWEELAKGLLGVTVMLTVLTEATNLIAKDTSGLVRAGVAMIPMSIGLLILSQAVKAFSTMSWAEMAKGMVGVAVGLGLIVAAMNLMPVGSTIAAGLAMIPIATGLTILAGAVKLFSMMSWEEMGKGMAGIGAGLLIIAGAMHLMPINLPITAAGMVILATALGMMAGVIGLMGTMKLETLAKGLGALAAMMLILGVAMNNISMSVKGAAALLIVSGALFIMANVLQTLGSLSIAEIVTGLAAVAGVFLILGIAAKLLTPVIPALISLGFALALIGASFALFGAGAMLIAKSFEIMVKMGSSVVKVLLDTIKEVLKAIPSFISTLVTSLMQSAGDILTVGRLLIGLATVLIIELLDSLMKVIPKFMQTMDMLLTGLITLIWNRGPEFIATGIMLMMQFLTGIANNMGQITQKAIDIIVAFAETLTANAQKIVDAAVNLIIAFIGAIGSRATDLVTAGADMLVDFLEGIANNVSKVITAGADIIIKFIEGIASNAVRVANAAGQTIVDFLDGMTQAVNTYAPQIRQKSLELGWAIINGISGGLAERIGDVITWLGGLVTKIPEWVGDLSQTLVQAGKDILTGLWNGLDSLRGWLTEKIKELAKAVMGPFAKVLELFSPSKVFYEYGVNIIKGLVFGLESMSKNVENSSTLLGRKVTEGFSVDEKVVTKSLKKLVDILSNMTDFNPTITPVLDLTRVQQTSRDLNRMLAVSALSPMISPTVSYAQANQIAKTTEIADTESKVPPYQGPAEVKFEQNIYSPSALSTNDIYRNTRSQIAKAKEELRIA